MKKIIASTFLLFFVNQHAMAREDICPKLPGYWLVHASDKIPSHCESMKSCTQMENLTIKHLKEDKYFIKLSYTDHSKIIENSTVITCANGEIQAPSLNAKFDLNCDELGHCYGFVDEERFSAEFIKIQ